DGLGIKHFDTRLQQQDLRLAGRLKGAQWLGMSIEDLGNADAVLVVGANLRKEQPLLTARLRRAAKAYMALSVIASSREELHMPLFAHEILHPNDWADFLSKLAQDTQSAVSDGLKQAGKAAIVLGAEVQNHPDYAAIYAAAQQLAAATGAVLGILPQAANSVGADVLGVNGGQTVQEMLAQPKKAVLLLNVEPEIDVAGGAKAVAALKQAQSVMAFTPFESEILREVCDVMLPIAPFTETSGSFINMEGRLQSFHGVVKGLADSRPLWKVLRVLGNVFGLDGFEYDSSEQVLKEAVKQEGLSEKLNNQSTWQGASVQTASGLVRVGGVGIYHTDALVRRSAPLQATSHAQTPAARVHPNTLAALGLQDGERARAVQGGARVDVSVAADAHLPENVVYLPLHTANAALGALMNRIELERA
ncbi:molybdopterin-dependent oxidoreductase, partial [Neisseria dentiae]|uniref:molybdopterin-dependent oxidoreductase n=1 Tax=Neisseria dentiae TaxID=194197 RepID=UPI0035A04F24